MKRPAAKAPPTASPKAPAKPARPLPANAIAAVLFALHVVLAVWVATRNSVTFDENFHLPAGVVAIARGDVSSSFAQPPLARLLPGAFALAAGAKLPDPRIEQPGAERTLGEAFMRANADRFTRVFFAGRLAAVLVSALLAWLVWRLARRWYGEAAGLVALAAWALSPEALAHGSLVGVDVPTALVDFGFAVAGFTWLRSGARRDWFACAAWLAAALLVRFSAAQLPVMLGVMALVLAWRGKLANPRGAILGFALFAPVALLALNVGYRFQGTSTELGHIQFLSQRFIGLAKHWPHLRLPLPWPYLLGLDYLSLLSEPGQKLSYLLGEMRHGHDWNYFPVAISVKWPLGLLAFVVLRIAHLVRRGAAEWEREVALLLPAGTVLATAFSTNLDYGVRYVLPALPFLCVWAAGTLASGARRGAPARAWGVAAVALVAISAAETATALPYPLAYFNALAGGPANAERIVNDSNVDWGQGLVALRDEMRMRGVKRLQLAYHGTTDPAMYGIDYLPYYGGMIDSTADYFAVSSYFYVGLPARVITPKGFTPMPARYDMRPLWSMPPDARPANCMYLYRIH